MIIAPRHLLRALVRAYRYFVSPLLPQACRFYPSCSSYAEQALQDHGALRGGWLTARRLCRCGPWHAGGFDPVPDVILTARAPVQGQQ
jgi:putative membrane protein insertion efficiency factor